MMSDHALEKAVVAALADMRKLKPVLADPAAAKARLRRSGQAEQLADVAALRRATASDTLLRREEILFIRNELAAPEFSSATPASGYLSRRRRSGRADRRGTRTGVLFGSSGNARAKLDGCAGGPETFPSFSTC